MSVRLLETMRAEGGRVALLGRHLARLGASAAALGLEADLGAARRAVEAAVGEGAEGVRLTLGEAGLDVATWPLVEAPFRTAWVDPEPLLEAGTWRCAHKTTDRAHYAARFDRARALGADEAVLVNDRGEVTEGTRTNVWAEIDGRLWTPPLEAGGLGGVFRAHVLATDPRAGERTLAPADLVEADGLFVSNALRGWMPVRLVG